jgi:hypothetical protein
MVRARFGEVWTMSVALVRKRVEMPATFLNMALRLGSVVRLAGALGLAGLLCGCAGFKSPQNNQTTTQPPATQTYSISGTISPTMGGSGAMVTLSGAASATTTASSSGAYRFPSLAKGTYAVTPSKTGIAFDPGSLMATVSGANVTGLDFTATAQVSSTFSISGTISPTAGGDGATVTLSGAAGATTTASSSGAYSFPGLMNGNYNVAPTSSGYTFNPTSQNVTVKTTNVTGVNFTATAQQAHSVNLSWSASTSTAVGYNVYRSTVSGTGFVRVNPSLIGNLTYSDTTVHGGTTYYYIATAVDSSGKESADSNEVSAIIP